MEVNNNHISVKLSGEINQICEPLFSNSSINYFIFVRFYDDGTVVTFPTNHQWHQHFWKQKYQEESSILRLCEGINFWHSKDKLSAICEDAVRNFNIDNRLDIVERGCNYYDVFGFGGKPRETEMVEYYFNNIEKLKKFSLYFKMQAKEIIKKGDKQENRLILEKKQIRTHACSELIKKKDFFDKMNINKFFFANCILSRREIECLILLLRGRTAIEIGGLLNISSKTSESYIEKLKNKLHCNSRAELFDAAYSMRVHELAKDISFVNKYSTT